MDLREVEIQLVILPGLGCSDLIRFAELLAGAFFVETIFGWKGIGKVTVDALEKLDFPVVMGSVLVSSFFFIVIGLLADLLYGLVDPRVRLTTSR